MFVKETKEAEKASFDPGIETLLEKVLGHKALFDATPPSSRQMDSSVTKVEEKRGH